MFTLLRKPSVIYVLLVLVLLSFQVALHSYQSLTSLPQRSGPAPDPKPCSGGSQLLPSASLSTALYRRVLARALQILHAGDEASYDCILPGFDELNSATMWVQARRWLRVTMVCEGFRPPAPLFPYKFMRIAGNLNVGFCTNYKAGTTTWIRYLLEWSGVKVEQNTDTGSIHRISNQAFDLISNNTKLGEELVKKRRPFLFFSVRHPYERYKQEKAL